MLLHRLFRRAAPILAICLLGSRVSNVAAQMHVPGTSQLGGWTYIDRNNDGNLAFANQPSPEFVIGDVEIKLFSLTGGNETLVMTTKSDEYGRYFFNGLSPGTYTLKQLQPIEFVDGIDTLGQMQSLNNMPVPASAFVGTMTNDAFNGIVLPANVRGDHYNFGERGLGPAYVSKRFLLGSAPVLPNAIPEPSTVMLVLAATGGGLLMRRRRGLANSPRCALGRD
jgi:hypothetical protein